MKWNEQVIYSFFNRSIWIAHLNESTDQLLFFASFLSFLHFWFVIQWTIFFLSNTFSKQNLGEISLPNVCLMTFDNATLTSNPSNINSRLNHWFDKDKWLKWILFSIFICPSSCYTIKYKTDHNRYPIYGNDTYSGVTTFSFSQTEKKTHWKIDFVWKNSLICKSAIHDGRVAPWISDQNTVLIQNNSNQLSSFSSVLRNGILSSKFD